MWKTQWGWLMRLKTFICFHAVSNEPPCSALHRRHEAWKENSSWPIERGPVQKHGTLSCSDFLQISIFGSVKKLSQILMIFVAFCRRSLWKCHLRCANSRSRKKLCVPQNGAILSWSNEFCFCFNMLRDVKDRVERIFCIEEEHGLWTRKALRAINVLTFFHGCVAVNKTVNVYTFQKFHP